MDFYTILDHVVDLLRQRQRVTYRAPGGSFSSMTPPSTISRTNSSTRIRRCVRTRAEGCSGRATLARPPHQALVQAPERLPLIYTPSYLAEKIPPPGGPGRRAQAGHGAVCRSRLRPS